MKTLKIAVLTLFVLSLFAPLPAAEAAVKKVPAKQGKKMVHVKKIKAKNYRSKVKVRKQRAVKKRPVVKAQKKTAISKEQKKTSGTAVLKTVLPKEVGSVNVTSHKSVVVYFDDEVIGCAPILIDGVRPGRHLVEAYIGSELYFRQYVDVKPLNASMIEINGKKDIAEEDPNFII